MDKSEIRQKVITARMEIPEALRKLKSRHIIQALEGLEEFQSARDLLAYYSVAAEPDTRERLEAWSKSKRLYLPKLTDESSFKAVTYGPTQPNQFNIPEPTGGQEAEKLDLILVPGVAFDLKGNRIGMGKGYYDRFLTAHKDVLKIGLAFTEQILESLPKEPYDIGVDFVVTDTEIIKIK